MAITETKTGANVLVILIDGAVWKNKVTLPDGRSVGPTYTTQKAALEAARVLELENPKRVTVVDNAPEFQIAVEAPILDDPTLPPTPPPPPPDEPPRPSPQAGHPQISITSPARGAFVTADFDVEFTVDNLHDTLGVIELMIDGVVHQSADLAARRFRVTLAGIAAYRMHEIYVVVRPAVQPLNLSPHVVVFAKPGEWPALAPVPPLKAVNPFLYFRTPEAGDGGERTAGASYVRGRSGAFKFSAGPNRIVIGHQVFGGGQMSMPGPLRLRVNGKPASFLLPVDANRMTVTTDWTPPTDAVGTCVLDAVTELDHYWCEPIAFFVEGRQTPANEVQDVPVLATYFDASWQNISPRREPAPLEPFFVRYPGQLPKFAGERLPKRVYKPWSEPASNSWKGFYGRALGISTIVGWPRRFTLTNDGVIDTHGKEQYHYYSGGSYAMPMNDGERGHAGLGHIWDMKINPVLGSIYALNTQGQFFIIHASGRKSVIAGPRKIMQGVPGKLDQVEWIGNYVNCPKPNQPWGFSWDSRDGDENDPKTFWRNFYVADSFNHVITHVDISRIVFPGEQATIKVLAGVPGTFGYRDGPFEQALFDTPWSVRQHPTKKHLFYVIEKNSHRLRELNMDTRMVSTVFESALKPPLRQPDISASMTFNPGLWYHKPGPTGVGTLMYPSGMDFDSKGRLLLACHWATKTGHNATGGCLVRYDFDTGLMSDTLYAPPSDANGRDWHIAVNAKGGCGPQDCVYGSRWGFSFYLEPNTSDGYAIAGKPFYSETPGWYHAAMREGQAPMCQYPTYPSCFGLAPGRVVVAGVGTDGIMEYSPLLPGDRVLPESTAQATIDKLIEGRRLYLRWWGLRHGVNGFDTLEGVGFAEARQFARGDFIDILKNGWGLPFAPPLTQVELGLVADYVRWPLA